MKRSGRVNVHFLRIPNPRHRVEENGQFLAVAVWSPANFPQYPLDGGCVACRAGVNVVVEKDSMLPVAGIEQSFFGRLAHGPKYYFGGAWVRTQGL